MLVLRFLFVLHDLLRHDLGNSQRFSEFRREYEKVWGSALEILARNGE